MPKAATGILTRRILTIRTIMARIITIMDIHIHMRMRMTTLTNAITARMNMAMHRAKANEPDAGSRKSARNKKGAPPTSG